MEDQRVYRECTPPAYHKYFGIPTRLNCEPRSSLLTTTDNSALDYCDDRNYFKEENAVEKVRESFEISMRNLINACWKPKYQALAKQCLSNYKLFVATLTHYRDKGHYSSYGFELHKNSTNMKNNLLKLLQRAEKEAAAAVGDQQALNRKLADKEGVVEHLKQTLEVMQMKTDDLQNLLEEALSKQGSLAQKIEDLQRELQRKDKELQDVKKTNQKMKEDLKGIENELETLHMIEEPIKKPCRKIKSQKEVNISWKDEDLQRYLLVQALSIESLLNQ